MSKTLLVIVFLISLSAAFGQDINPAVQRTGRLPLDNAVQISNGLDTLTNTVRSKADLLPNAVETDSIPRALNVIKKKLQDSVQRASGFQEGVQHWLEKAKSKTDSLSQRITSVDDTLKQKLDAGIQRAKETTLPLKANEVNADVTEKLNVDNVPGTDKLNELSEKIDVPDAAFPDTKSNDAVSMDLGLPSKDLPVTSIPDSEEVKAPVPATSNDVIEKLRESTNVDIPDTDKVDELSDKAKEVGENVKAAEKYQDEASKIKQGDLGSMDDAAEQAEEKATDAAGIRDVSERANKLTEQNDKLAKQQEESLAMIQKYRDKKLEREEILRKTKNIANDKLNKFSPAVKEGTEKLAEVKKARAGVSSIKAFLTKENAMKSKSFYERLVPGISLQAYKQKVYSIDFAPQVGFKISGRFTVGAGGIYRVGLSEKFDRFAEGVGVYGYRAYTDIHAFKGIFVHGEFEKLILDKYTAPQFGIEQQADQVTTFHIGLGKRYAISKKLFGNLLVLYRAEMEGHLPSMSKLNVRVGFDLNTKKKKRIAAL